MLLEITHHSGKKRWLNSDQIESVDVDTENHAVIRMTSGAEHVTSETCEHILMQLGAKVQMPKLITQAILSEPSLAPTTDTEQSIDPDIIPPRRGRK